MVLIDSRICFHRVSEMGDDAVKEAVLYFSGKPVESTRVNFNEYGYDEELYYRIILERMHPKNEGQPVFFFQNHNTSLLSMSGQLG